MGGYYRTSIIHGSVWVPGRWVTCELCKGKKEMPAMVCVACGKLGDQTSKCGPWGGQILCHECRWDETDPTIPARGVNSPWFLIGQAYQGVDLSEIEKQASALVNLDEISTRELLPEDARILRENLWDLYL